jgi:hypothetical protein
MRNSVILVDQIQQDMAAGHDAFTAIVGSAVRRFRPITLEAAAAVLALIPLAREVFWAPMALAMMGGLIEATILTLTFLPALYALAFRVALQPGRLARLDDSNLKFRHGVVVATRPQSRICAHPLTECRRWATAEIDFKMRARQTILNGMVLRNSRQSAEPLLIMSKIAVRNELDRSRSGLRAPDRCSGALSGKGYNTVRGLSE